jgi:hypothetical protein
MGLVQHGSQAYRLDEGNLLTTVIYCSVWAWQPARCVSKGISLWWKIAEGCSPSPTPLWHCDLDGAIYTRFAEFYLFSFTAPGQVY